MIYVSMDDTDNLESRGTGSLARTIAGELSKDYQIYGVTRHQLYDHPDIPYTSHNTCAVIQIENKGVEFVDEIFEMVKHEMLDDFMEGSDPGLVVVHDNQITPAMVAFGIDAKCIVLNQQRARKLADNLNIRLEGLGGTEDGVIGAMAGVGLASSKYDGRFLRIGTKDVKGYTKTAEELFEAGVDQIVTVDGRNVTDGLIHNPQGRLLKTCPLGDKIILFVEEADGELKVVDRG
jgi:tRNA(Ile2) C34 agmatinyltransferase TiaS